MPEEKICPIMSRAVMVGSISQKSIRGIIPLGSPSGDLSYELFRVTCQREKCMAWNNNEEYCELIRRD